MGESIWSLCDFGRYHPVIRMMEYNTKSKKSNQHHYPYGSGVHSMCKNKKEIYIVHATKIIVFDPRNKTFQEKIKIPDIGHSATCISLHDEIHIFGGSKNSKKHLVYKIKQNEIKTLNDSAATQPGITHFCVTQYKNKVIRFGGYKSGTYYSEVVISADAIKANTEHDIKWKTMPLWKCTTSVIRSGCITYNQYIIMFGGTTKAGKTDSIYILNVLNRYKGWMKLKHLKCPEKEDYIAGLDKNNDVHLISTTTTDTDHYFHYSIAISSIITKDITAALNVEDQKDDIKEENDPKPTQSTQQLEQLLKEKQETEAKLACLQKEKDELKNKYDRELTASKKLKKEKKKNDTQFNGQLEKMKKETDELKKKHDREVDALKKLNEELTINDTERQQKMRKMNGEKRQQQSRINELEEQLKRLNMKQLKTYETQNEPKLNEKLTEQHTALTAKLREDQLHLNECKAHVDDVEKVKEEEQEQDCMVAVLKQYNLLEVLQNEQHKMQQQNAERVSKLKETQMMITQEYKECNKKATRLQQHHNELTDEYIELKKERAALESQWKDVLTKLNDKIDLENEKNEELNDISGDYQVFKLEKQQWNALKEENRALLESYRAFKSMNEKNIRNKENTFNYLLKQAMQKWYKWTANDIAAWLEYLVKTKEVQLTKEVDFDAVLSELKDSEMNGSSLKDFDKSDIKSIGFKPYNDRVAIYKKIVELRENRYKLPATESMIAPEDDEEKEGKGGDKRCNLLIISVAIAKYDKLENLNTAKDLAVYKKTFVEKYGYKMITNDPEKRMTAAEVRRFLNKTRANIYDWDEDKLNYDGIILTYGGHGAHDGIICSDGSILKHKKIRAIFASDELSEVPKFFLIDACREDVSETQDDKGRGGKNAAAFSSTLMTNEGHVVYGAKICKYITKNMDEAYNMNQFKDWRSIYSKAKKSIKKETNNQQDLILCEHDIEVDDVVFVPNDYMLDVEDEDKARGSGRKRKEVDQRQRSLAASK